MSQSDSFCHRLSYSTSGQSDEPLGAKTVSESSNGLGLSTSRLWLVQEKIENSACTLSVRLCMSCSVKRVAGRGWSRRHAERLVMYKLSAAQRAWGPCLAWRTFTNKNPIAASSPVPRVVIGGSSPIGRRALFLVQKSGQESKAQSSFLSCISGIATPLR